MTVRSGDRAIGGRRCGHTTLFVDNLPMNVNNRAVHELFWDHGRVMDVFVPWKLRGGKRVRFAFVRFQNQVEAEREIRLENGRKYEGAFLRVQFARFERQPKAIDVNRNLQAPRKDENQEKVEARVREPGKLLDESNQGRDENPNMAGEHVLASGGGNIEVDGRRTDEGMKIEIIT